MLTSKEVAAKCGCSLSAVTGYVKKGYLHPIKVKRACRDADESEIKRLEKLHPDGYISTPEAAAILHCERNYIVVQARNGNLPYRAEHLARGHEQYFYKISDVAKLHPCIDKVDKLMFDEAEVDALPKKLGYDKMTLGAPEGYVCLKDAATMLGCSITYVKQRVRELNFSHICGRGRHGDTTYYYLIEDIEKLRPAVGEFSQDIKGLISSKEAADLLFVHRAYISNVVRAGKLTPAVVKTHGSRRVFYFKTEDVLALSPRHVVNMDGEWIKRIADICGVDDTTVAHWVLDGYIGYHLVDGKRVVTEEDAAAFFDVCCRYGDWRTDKYYSYKDISMKIGISVSKLRHRLQAAGVGQAMVLCNRYVRFLESDLDNFFKGDEWRC